MTRKGLTRGLATTCILMYGASSFLVPLALAHSSYKKPKIVYGASLTPVWNSNPLMLRDAVRDIYGSEAKAYIGFQQEMLTSYIKGDFTAVQNRYDQSEFNSTDFYAKVSMEKTYERTVLGLTSTYDYDTTRSSELTTFGREIGTGRRSAYTVQPTFAFQATPRTTIGFSGRWQEVRYESESLSNYRIASISPAVSYHLTPLQIATLSFQAQRYSLLDNSEQYIDSLGPSLAWSYNFHPIWTLNLSTGSIASRIHGYTGVEDQWDRNMVYGMSLKYSGLQHSSVFSATRARQPYANGTEAYLTTLEASDKYKVNPNLDLEFKGNYQFAKNPPQFNDNLETAWGGNLALNYKIGMNWAASASYKYRSEDLANQSEPADQQIVRVGLSYQFGKM
jgi:hypothetical protein